MCEPVCQDRRHKELVELVHKLLQPSLGSDGDDDGLFEKGILEKKVPEKFNFMLGKGLINLNGTMTT